MMLVTGRWQWVWTGLLVLNYYLFSIGLTFYNKKVVTKFPYPLVMTCIHLVIKFVLACLVRGIMECVSRHRRITLSWLLSIQSMAPVGLTAILDISLSNWSFEFITISLYTMTKTSAIVFLLFFALLLRVEKFRWLQLLVVVFISVGLFLFTFQSTQFNLTGFLLCLSASAISGLRWSLSQKVLQKQQMGLENPVDFIYHIQPWMIVGILPMVFTAEGLKFAIDANFMDYHDLHVIFVNMAVLIGGALIAFLLEFAEFLLVIKTSSLSLSVSAMFKEMIVLLLSEKINGDSMTLVNGFGLVACLVGIAIHLYLKATAIDELPVTNSMTEENVSLIQNTEEMFTDSEQELDRIPSMTETAT